MKGLSNRIERVFIGGIIVSVLLTSSVAALKRGVGFATGWSMDQMWKVIEEVLWRKSDLVVMGEVIKIEVKEDSMVYVYYENGKKKTKQLPYLESAYVTIQPEMVLKSTLSLKDIETVKIKAPGPRLRVSYLEGGRPKFKLEDKVLLFLKKFKHPSYIGNSHFIPAEKGLFFYLICAAAGEFIIEDREIYPLGAENLKMPLDEFLMRIGKLQVMEEK